jgi:magnesium-transporting ATPase (P-type)
MPTKIITFAEQFFWTMIWVVLILVVFVFLSNWAKNNDIPFLSSVFSWSQSHAGLEQ